MPSTDNGVRKPHKKYKKLNVRKLKIEKKCYKKLQNKIYFYEEKKSRDKIL